MPEQLALLLCIVGIAVLFYLNRDRSVRNSSGLWVPVIWLALVGSRPVSFWFGMAPTGSDVDGSPLDAAVYGVLVAAGITVLGARAAMTRRYLAILTPIIIYSLYCLASVTWSPVPVPALKRWIKDVGDVVMVLIIVTDIQPLEALRRIYTRVGFILFPLSVFLIRYTTLGRAWDNDGNLSIVGVTTNKNVLGLIVFVISLGALWNFRSLLATKTALNRGRRLAAAGLLLTFGLYLLNIANSSTSKACFVLGSGLMLATHLRAFKRKPSRVHWLCAAVLVLMVTTTVFGGSGDVAEALGRQASFSGRTDIWAALFPAAANPIIGSGFDSFWNSPNVLIFQQGLSLIHWFHPERLNEAHNGYLEVYLNLGWIGVFLITVILATGYSRASKALRLNRELGSLALAYVISGAIYCLTEAGFRTLNPMWIFILLAVVSASGVNARLLADRIVAPSRGYGRRGQHRWAQAAQSAREQQIYGR